MTILLSIGLILFYALANYLIISWYDRAGIRTGTVIYRMAIITAIITFLGETALFIGYIITYRNSMPSLAHGIVPDHLTDMGIGWLLFVFFIGYWNISMLLLLLLKMYIDKPNRSRTHKNIHFFLLNVPIVLIYSVVIYFCLR